MVFALNLDRVFPHTNTGFIASGPRVFLSVLVMQIARKGNLFRMQNWNTKELSKNNFYKLTCPDSMKGWMRTKLESQRSSGH
jgi:hypothetical protein